MPAKVEYNILQQGTQAGYPKTLPQILKQTEARLRIFYI